jgi:hypothetical protein
MSSPGNISSLGTLRQGPAFTALSVVALMAVAAFLRFSDLETNPPGLWQDEASTGLDAYLLWTTGQDRAGERYPIIARSFGDYPLAGYRYLAAPIVGLFGLTMGHERLVAAFFGTLMVLVAGWASRQRFGPGAGLFTLLSCTFAPTWLHFSRYGSEAILLPTCLVLGWALVDWGRDERRRIGLWLGAASLAASAYTYHAVKLFLPLWLAGFVVLQWPLIRAVWRQHKVHLIGPALVFALGVAPSMVAAVTEGGMARGRTVLAWYQAEGMTLFRLMLGNYLSYFDPGMLYVRGGPAVAQSIPGLGMWNLVELPLMVLGLATMFRPKAQRRAAGFVLFWFLLGPVPGGVTYETHNMGRAIAWLPAPQLIAGWGGAVAVRWAWGWAREVGAGWRRGLGVASLLALLAGWSATAYAVWWCTLVRYPKVTERDWQFEITQSMQCALANRVDETLIVSPHFQMASVFAEFHFAHADEAAGKRIWRLGVRDVVSPGELYLTPQRGEPPKGKVVCKVVHGPTGQIYAQVFGPPDVGPDPEPGPTSAPGAPPTLRPSATTPVLDLRRHMPPGLAPPPPPPPPAGGAPGDRPPLQAPH